MKEDKKKKNKRTKEGKEEKTTKKNMTIVQNTRIESVKKTKEYQQNKRIEKRKSRGRKGFFSRFYFMMQVELILKQGKLFLHHLHSQCSNNVLMLYYLIYITITHTLPAFEILANNWHHPISPVYFKSTTYLLYNMSSVNYRIVLHVLDVFLRVHPRCYASGYCIPAC